ncbi:hypothetical protein THAOC_37879 [Thalassiosira oceanica]|uniref:SAP domain-containing protein n=1 Tax=Thalassiosira oceanica TaxID=159749 RepID=K0R576_THAOC|nr:hypothetical protein THAOC_37879 [Thalassiosira oceanica]|eukprot:EJK43656.1 hypothetical protein THAOC_37879 [Thalassiosira oceanica]
MLAHQTPSQASQQHLTTSMKSEVPSGVRQRERRTGWAVQVAGVLKPTPPKLELRQQRLLLQSKANTSQGNRRSPRTTERVEQKKKKSNSNASGKQLVEGMKWIAERFRKELEYHWFSAADWCALMNELNCPHLKKFKLEELKPEVLSRTFHSTSAGLGGVDAMDLYDAGMSGWFHNRSSSGGQKDQKAHYYCFGTKGEPLPENNRPATRGFSALIAEANKVRADLMAAMKVATPDRHAADGASVRDATIPPALESRRGPDTPARKANAKLETAAIKAKDVMSDAKNFKLFVRDSVTMPDDPAEQAKIVYRAICDRLDRLKEGMVCWANVIQGASKDDGDIKMAAGYLGRHNHDDKLKVGEVQTMVFRETDKGPFHWSEKDREDNKYDDFGDWDWVDLTCDELREKLEAKNVDSRGVKKTIQRRCTNSGISIRKRVQKLKTLGWVGKPKGVFQILWERGFIDPMRINDYTMNGSIDKSTGLRDNELSLNYLIRQCVDFLHEKTLLQYNGEALGCIVDRSPKCTPEIAGDGIEFDWAMAKLWFRMQKVEKRKKKQDFLET